MVGPFVVFALMFRSDLLVDFVSMCFGLLHRLLVLWGSLDVVFFGGFRLDFISTFESNLKGVGFIW